MSTQTSRKVSDVYLSVDDDGDPVLVLCLDDGDELYPSISKEDANFLKDEGFREVISEASKEEKDETEDLDTDGDPDQDMGGLGHGHTVDED